jgi:curved DNA-binding protein CbpA
MHIKQDYYQLLGIAPTASIVEIKQAYRKLAFQYHPDRNHMSRANDEVMKELNEAFITLSDSSKRRKYDIPLGYGAIMPKFQIGYKVKVNPHSATPYGDRIGVIDEEPIKDAFRFWYKVKFESNGLFTVNRFAEEELCEISEGFKYELSPHI